MQQALYIIYRCMYVLNRWQTGLAANLQRDVEGSDKENHSFYHSKYIVISTFVKVSIFFQSCSLYMLHIFRKMLFLHQGDCY